jgi:hypothetical protein
LLPVAIVENAKVRKMVRNSWKNPTRPTSSSRISSTDFHFFSPKETQINENNLAKYVQEDGDEQLKEKGFIYL